MIPPDIAPTSEKKKNEREKVGPRGEKEWRSDWRTLRRRIAKRRQTKEGRKPLGRESVWRTVNQRTGSATPPFEHQQGRNKDAERGLAGDAERKREAKPPPVQTFARSQSRSSTGPIAAVEPAQHGQIVEVSDADRFTRKKPLPRTGRKARAPPHR